MTYKLDEAERQRQLEAAKTEIPYLLWKYGMNDFAEAKRNEATKKADEVLSK